MHGCNIYIIKAIDPSQDWSQNQSRAGAGS